MRGIEERADDVVKDSVAVCAPNAVFLQLAEFSHFFSIGLECCRLRQKAPCELRYVIRDLAGFECLLAEFALHGSVTRSRGRSNVFILVKVV